MESSVVWPWSKQATTADLQAELDAALDVKALLNSRTPLHWVAYMNTVEHVQILFEAGADVMARTKDLGHTPLHFGTQNSTAVTKFFIDAGADVMTPDVLGETPLHSAARFGTLQQFKFS